MVKWGDDKTCQFFYFKASQKRNEFGFPFAYEELVFTHSRHWWQLEFNVQTKTYIFLFHNCKYQTWIWTIWLRLNDHRYLKCVDAYRISTPREKGALTLFGVGSKGFHSYENRLLDQTRGYVFVLSPLHHLQTHLFATYNALLCCPRIQSRSHHVSLPSVQRPLK